MKGKIEITADGVGVKVLINLDHVSKLDMFATFEALADGFKFSELDRMLLSLMFASNGLSRTKVDMSPELLDLIKKMKENNHETDAL